MNNQYGQIPGVHLYRQALPQDLFERLLLAVRKIGSDQTKSNGSYTTTFWFANGSVPGNVAEEAAAELLKLIGTPAGCMGVEWWIGRLGHGKKLRFHFDRDLALQEKTGEMVCPLLASVLYLNEYPSAPTVIVDQIPGLDGKSKDSGKAGAQRGRGRGTQQLCRLPRKHAPRRNSGREKAPPRSPALRRFAGAAPDATGQLLAPSAAGADLQRV